MSERTETHTEQPTPGTARPTALAEGELLALVRRIAEHAADRKAIDPVAIDLRGASAYTDAFLLLTGNTDRQVKAIHDAILEGLKHEGERLLPRRVEGLQESRWVLLDYGDVVVHVFVPEAREFYRLEALWGDRPRIDLGGIFEAPSAD